MIKLKNVSKRFKEREIFKSVNLELQSGKKILIKGPNGSGKSVFLKLIVGYSTPDSGSITIDGLTLKKDGDFIPDAGVSINAPDFVSGWSGLTNLLYLANIKKKVSQIDIMRYVDMLDLRDDINKKYKTYSLGMKQKLRIIQAVMEDPKYLILDEPFDALDKKSKATVLKILDDYINEGDHRTLVFASHDREAENFADIIFEIDDYDLSRIKEAIKNDA